MFLFTLNLAFMFNSCSEDDVNDEKEPPTNTTDSDDSGSDGDEDDNTGDNKVECRYCDGSGDCPGSNCNNGICFYCDGTGKVYTGKYESVCTHCERGKCPVCKGKNKCPKCNGRGYTYK